jgi:hypothetical protein
MSPTTAPPSCAAVTSQTPDLTRDPACTDGCQTVLLIGSCSGGWPRGQLLHRLQQATRTGRPDSAAQPLLHETPTALDSCSDRPVQDPDSRLLAVESGQSPSWPVRPPGRAHWCRVGPDHPDGTFFRYAARSRRAMNAPKPRSAQGACGSWASFRRSTSCVNSDRNLLPSRIVRVRIISVGRPSHRSESTARRLYGGVGPPCLRSLIPRYRRVLSVAAACPR